MKRITQLAIIVVIVMAMTTCAFGAGLALGGSGHLFEPGVIRAADEPAQFDVFWQAWNLIQNRFVDRSSLDTTQLVYGAIRGMVDATGDEGHTAFLPPEEVEIQRSGMAGKFSGIGAQLGVKDSLPIIVAPFDGSPAAEAGVKAGDIIIDVDGEDVTTLPLNEIVDRIRGEAGTKVVLTVLRPDDNKSLEIPIVRGEITVPAASWAMVPDTSVALIRLSQFSANAKDDLVKAVTEAKADGATGLIVDLRSNPGGLLEQAISVTSQFLKDGNVLQQEDAEGNRQAYPVESGGVATDLPIVVLINRGTASSSEIFAGAIQDHKRGPVVGETTFGTGTVLEPFPLDDGSLLMLGTSQWLTADGRLIRKHGIEPDVEVKLPIGTDLVTPQKLKDLSATELKDSEDAQFLKALNLLETSPAVDKVGAESVVN
ncbi:MAG: S41 family peptidase [Anaerolineales bacterium]|nr:S41 family peptidase [Anaerolineales bacterium]